MHKQFEVMVNILPLLTTMEEGFKHIKQQLAELRYEEAFVMLGDVVQGMTIVENALVTIENTLKALQNDTVRQSKLDLNRSIYSTVKLYENRKYQELDHAVEATTHAFMAWKKCVEKIIRPRVAS